MNKLFNKTKFLLSLVVIVSTASKPADKWVVQKQELKNNWQIESSAKVTGNGQEISAPDF